MINVEIKYASSYHTGKLETYYLRTDIDSFVLDESEEKQRYYLVDVISQEAKLPIENIKVLAFKRI